MNSTLFLTFFFFNLLLISFRLKNVLMILFAMEFITVNMLFSLIYLSCCLDTMTLLVFLAVAASEASIGLSLMVVILRQLGNDNLLVS